jgi:hypothetical protein
MIHGRLTDDLKGAKQQIENYVIQGNVQDFASYRYLVGQIKGLQDAIDICNTTFKRREDE